jgi:L-amino acid N-acyltransferase YncA
MHGVTIAPATADDLPAILPILNDAIATSTASWHEYPRDETFLRGWLVARQKDYVVLAARDASGLVGCASYGPYRSGSGYRLTVEHSVYVRKDARRRGIGKALLAALIDAARAQGLHVIVAGIDGDNAVSIALHRDFGFVETGRLPEVGHKFGRWLTLVIMQKTL